MTRTTLAALVLVVTVLTAGTVAAAPTAGTASDTAPSVEDVASRDSSGLVPDDCDRTEAPANGIATTNARATGANATTSHGQTAIDATSVTAPADANASCRSDGRSVASPDCGRPDDRTNASGRRGPSVALPGPVVQHLPGTRAGDVDGVGFGLGWMISNFTPGEGPPPTPDCGADRSDDDHDADDGQRDWSPPATDDGDGDDGSGNDRGAAGNGAAAGGGGTDCESPGTAPGSDHRPDPPAGSAVPENCE